MENQSVNRAFEIAKEIRALLCELNEELVAITKIVNIPAVQRHLIMQQIVECAQCGMSDLNDLTKQFLDEHVDKLPKTSVEGMQFDNAFVSGMAYEYRTTKKVELINKDDATWAALVKALVLAGHANVIQKRLNPSAFFGVNRKELLTIAGGLVATSTDDGQWSITKPKEPRQSESKRKNKIKK